MDDLKTYLCDKPIDYDGSQLRNHWIYDEFDLLGNTIIAFVGSARVDLDHMVDKEDVRNKAPIYSPKMLHFIAEWFGDSLEQAILLQHLFINEIYELLLESGTKDLFRRGNDIYYQERKLSVSIATKTNVSLLMHAGINIDTQGTPIPTSGLSELEIDPLVFAKETLDRFASDYRVWQKARYKVSPR